MMDADEIQGPGIYFLCRDCQHGGVQDTVLKRCPQCGSIRLLQNSELHQLSIAHIDCDAFYASVEKRDRPELRAKPLIIGGGQRGVVSTACYIARLSGVRSAMPMFKARKLCPDAVVLKPDMAKYRSVSREIRARFDALTPLVEPLSLDEAFLDLSGTKRLHGKSPVSLLMDLQDQIHQDLGITVSVGLSYNKFLAKLGSDLEKPSGFTIIGRETVQDRLAPLPISRIIGIGKQATKALARDGLTHIHQLQAMSEGALMQRYGEHGQALYRYSRGIDTRSVKAHRAAKSVSSETTFRRDLSDPADLEKALWAQCERTARDAKAKGLAGLTVTLKLKTAMHKTITRSKTLDQPTQLADTLYREGLRLLTPLIGQTTYRLIGIGISQFRPLSEADQPDLIESDRDQRAKAERAMDTLRAKFGQDLIQKGRSL